MQPLSPFRTKASRFESIGPLALDHVHYAALEFIVASRATCVGDVLRGARLWRGYVPGVLVRLAAAGFLNQTPTGFAPTERGAALVRSCRVVVRERHKRTKEEAAALIREILGTRSLVERKLFLMRCRGVCDEDGDPVADKSA